MKRFWIAVLLLGGLAALLYLPTGTFGFLRLDDHDYTFRCAFVFDGLSWANIKEAFTNVRHAGVWMPITYISYMADVSLFGPGPGAHHLVNMALHSVNTMLLLALAWRLAGGRNAAWLVLAVAFWALHPQRAEAVAWIACRKELLWTCFALAGLLCWHRANCAQSIGAAWRFFAYLFCAMACMSKPTAICFPALALCVDLATAGHGGKAQMREFRSRLRAYIPIILMAVFTGALAIYSQTHPEGHEIRGLFSASLAWRLLNAAVAIGLYLWQMFVPIGIHIDYRAVPGQFPLHGTIGLSVFILALCLVTFLIIRKVLIKGTDPQAEYCKGTDPQAEHCKGTDPKVAHSQGTDPIVRVGTDPIATSPTVITTVWFLAGLTPTLGIFGSFGEHARADRFLYLPAMAIVFFVARILYCRNEITERMKLHCGKNEITVRMKSHWGKIWGENSGRIWVGMAGMVVVGMAVAAWPVVDSYRSDHDVFSRTLKFDPDHGRALAHVGQAECARPGGIDKGIGLIRRGQALRPRDDTAAQLAYALAMRGHSDDFAEIRRLCSKFACDHSLDRKGQALEALGMTALRQRRWKEAASCLEDSIRAPGRFYSAEDAQLRLAAAYCNGGRTDKAIQTLERLTQSRRADIRGKAIQSLETIKRNPRTVLFLD